MAKLVIARSSEWNNRARRINIILDGEQIGKIANGDTKEFEIAAGMHTLKAKIDWCGSRDMPFMINEGEVKTVSLSGFKYAGILAPVGVLLFYLSMKFELTLLLVPAVAVLLIIVYYLTIGRNDYLVLKPATGNL